MTISMPSFDMVPHAFGQFSPCGRGEIRRGRRGRHRRSVGAAFVALAEPARGDRGQGAGRTGGRRQGCVGRSQVRRRRARSGHPQPRQDPLRRPQLCEPCRRGRPAAAHRAQRLLPPAQHAGAARRQHRAAARLDRFRLRGRAGHRDRRALPARAARQRALGRGGLHLLPRRQRARLPEALGDGRQELPGDRPARAVDGDGRRDRRSAGARAHDAAERQRPCSTTRPIT